VEEEREKEISKGLCHISRAVPTGPTIERAGADAKVCACAIGGCWKEREQSLDRPSPLNTATNLQDRHFYDTPFLQKRFGAERTEIPVQFREFVDSVNAIYGFWSCFECSVQCVSFEKKNVAIFVCLECRKCGKYKCNVSLTDNEKSRSYLHSAAGEEVDDTKEGRHRVPLMCNS